MKYCNTVYHQLVVMFSKIKLLYNYKFLLPVDGINELFGMKEGRPGSILRKISCCTWGNQDLFFSHPSKVQVILNNRDSNSYNN